MRGSGTAILFLLGVLAVAVPARAQHGGAEGLDAPSPGGDQAGPGSAGTDVAPPAPPPPPGYGAPSRTQAAGATGATHGQPQLPADLEAAWRERQELEAQIELAREEVRQHSLAWPIVMVATGGGMMIGGAWAYVMTEAASSTCIDDCDDTNTAQLVAGIVGIGGIGLAVIGVVHLVNTLNDRAPHVDHWRELQRRKRELDRMLQPYGYPIAGGAVVGLQASF